MAEFRFISQVGGEVRHVLYARVAVPNGGDIRERLLDGCCPEQAVGQRDGYPGEPLPEVDQPIRPLEVGSSRERRRVHEYRRVLTDPKVSEVDKRKPQPRVARRPNGRRVAAKEVELNEGVDVPIVERGGRPGVQRQPGGAGTEVHVLSLPLRGPGSSW